MKKTKFTQKKSISKRVQFAFILIILLLSTGFVFSIYERNITTEKYDENMDINIKLGKLSVEFSSSWGFFDMYVKTNDAEYIQKYNNSNSIIEKMLKQIEPSVEKNVTCSIYLRNLNGMFALYKTKSYHVIKEVLQSHKLNEMNYVELTELKTLFSYMNKHSELLMVSYLNYSNTEYLSALEKYKNTEIQVYIILIIIVIISFIFAMLISRDLGRTIGKLRKYAELLSDGKWEILDIGDQKYEELNSLAKAFNKMKNSIRVFIDELNEKAEIEKNYHIEKLRSAEKDKLIKETQLLALQSQMNPHFLFNTLNTISRMAMFESADSTVKLIEATSKILRYNLDYKDKLVQLKEEIRMTQAYVVIQETRFQDQMRFAFDIDENLSSINVPPMLIQPIVENAIVHGLCEKDRGGMINILVKKQNNFISIRIIDNGIGMDAEKIFTLLSNEKNEAGGLGLFNVKKRLELYFNRRNLFKINSKLGEGTEVIILIPIGGDSPNDKTNDS